MRRAKGLVAYYGAKDALPGLKVNGELTLGENIGDLTGLVIAHRAYTTSLKGQSAPVMDGLTGNQRFFAGWAQAWRAKIRDDALRQQVLERPARARHGARQRAAAARAGLLRGVRREAGRQVVPAARGARQDLVAADRR